MALSPGHSNAQPFLLLLLLSLSLYCIQRRKLYILQEQHNDLLSLLAQQELELSVFRELLDARAGPTSVSEAVNEASQRCIERYGAYINCRDDFTDADGDSGSIDIV